MHIHPHFFEKARRVIHHLSAQSHVSRELSALYTSRTFMRLGLGVLGVFLPIFFYVQLGSSIETVLTIYVAIFGLYFLVLPYIARLLGYLGTRTMLGIGLLFVIGSLVSLYMFETNPEMALLAYIGCVVLYYSFYWLPYHVDFAESLSPRMRGRQIALLRNIAGVVMITTPLIGGFLITAIGFSAAFICSIVLLCVAMLPLYFMQNRYERYSWGYLETLQHLFARKNRSLVLANIANGAQGIVLSIIWPIFVFTLLDERYTALGVIVSLSLVVVTLLRTAIGKLFDTWSEKRIIIVSVLMTTTGWVAKIFVQTPFQVFAADSYHNAGNVANALAFDAATYEQAADNGRFIDEYTVIKELALTLGRLMMLLGMTALLAVHDLRVAFIVAALLSLLMMVINHAAKVR